MGGKWAKNETTGEISRKKELNKMEASNLPDTGFKAMVTKMLKEFSENFSNMEKGIETIKITSQK